MSKKSFDLVVIGAGPAGYVAAIRAAQLGLKVACIEKEKTLGGTCLNVGCIPSKALLESSHHFELAQHQFETHGIKVGKIKLDLNKMMERKSGIVKKLTSGIEFLFKKNKIESIKGLASFNHDKTITVKSEKEEITIESKSTIIATGSVPFILPHIQIDQKHIVDSTGALNLEKIPETLVVMGGGYIGLEMGSVYNRLGSKVIVVEAFDRIIPAMDQEVSKNFQRILTKQGFEFQLSTKIEEAKVEKNQVKLKLTDKDGQSKTLKSDVLLVSIGRKPMTDGLDLENVGIKLNDKNQIEVNENFETSVPGIYAIGDVIDGPMLAHKASEEGHAVAEIIAGQSGHVNYNTIPGVIYTSPEVASVGLTEEQVKEQGVDYKKFKFPFTANGRALSLEETDGFVKLIACKKTDQLLGAHIIGPRASDLISEIVLALEFSASSEDIARTIHAHPTLSEAVKEAALGLNDGPIHG